MRRIVLTAFILSLVLVAVPIFMPEPASAMTGSGTAEDPFMIYDVGDLQAMGNGTYPSSSYYELANDIDASATESWNGGAGFDPISGFTGSFDGNYYTISDLYIDRTIAGVGLFGGMTTGSPTIQNLYILDAYIKTIYASEAHCSAGVLIGASYGDASPNINRVMVSGIVYAHHTEPSGSPIYSVHAGGLIGFLWEGNAHVEKCASYANVTAVQAGYGYSYAGGLIGAFGTWYGSSAYVRNCYARGYVYGAIGDQYSGKAAGLIGYQDTNGSGGCLIQKSYSTGEVDGNVALKGFLGYTDYPSDTTNCFWDIETSGQTSSAGSGAVGKNTTDMKIETTFTNAGWDFDTIWGIGGGVAETVNNGYPYFLWWYDPYEYPSDFTQVVWFQPNAIIEGTELPNRAGVSYPDGIITWGANPVGITITHGGLVPEEEYDFVPIIPEGQDIIQPNPETMVGDIDLEALRNNPLYPLVQVLSIDGFLNERLVWIGLAWLIVIISMIGVHLGFDTHKNTAKPQHFVLTTITGLGLTIMFYTMGIFPLWTIILMSFGLVGAIIWERQPVI